MIPDFNFRELLPLHIKPTLAMTIMAPSADRRNTRSATRNTMTSWLK